MLRKPGDTGGELPSEVTDPAFSPDGRRLYVASQRGLPDGSATLFGFGGVIYEITMPFAVRVDPPLARALG